MGIEANNYSEQIPASDADIAAPNLECDDPCTKAQKKVDAEVRDALNHYQQNYGSRSDGTSLPGTSETYGHYLNPQQYRQVNQSINQYYGMLARDLDQLAWPKVAHVVSSQFGCSMDNFMEGGWSRGVIGIGSTGTPQQNDDAAVTLGEGVTRIFKNLYPPMRIIADEGPEFFLNCVKTGKIKADGDIIEAAENMAYGNFEAADNIIVDYEQKEIASSLYTKFSSQYQYIEDVARDKVIAFGWPDFKSVFPRTECLPVGGAITPGKVSFDGSLFDVNNRINFYKYKLKDAVLKNYYFNKLPFYASPLKPLE